MPTNADSYLRNTFALSGGLKAGKVTINSTINYLNKNQKAVPTGQGDDASGGKVIWQELIQIPRDHSIVDYKNIMIPMILPVIFIILIITSHHMHKIHTGLYTTREISTMKTEYSEILM